MNREEVEKRTGFKCPFDPNPIQEATFFPVFGTDDNVIVAAGTGCGKTLIYEWAMYKALSQGGHVVMLAPQKALVEQKAAAWLTEGHPLKEFPLIVKTGDYDIRPEQLEAHPIKIMTPESFSMCLRKRNQHMWLQRISLQVVDEIHTLGMAGRGNGLEAAMVNLYERKSGVSPRTVGLSATISERNLRDMSKWLYRLSGKKVAAIQSSWRPTPLTYHFHPYTVSKNYKRNEENKLDAAMSLIETFLAGGTPALVFVHTKKTGYRLVELMRQRGIGAEFHCADIPLNKRREIEENFLTKTQFLVATSTLALGCDFPVEDVVIVGVERGMNLVEKDTLQQMAGRAGHQSSCTHGYVHQLVPDSADGFDWEEYVRGPYHVKSELKQEKWFAFHAISVISYNDYAAVEDVRNWYGKTLAYAQTEERDGFSVDTVADGVVVDMIAYLREANAIEEYQGVYTATLLGKASAMFYFDPMDICRWALGCRALTVRNHAQACAILAKGKTLMSVLPTDEKDLPPAVKHLMCASGCADSPQAIFLYYLVCLSGDDFAKREDLPLPLKTPLPGFFKELHRVVACLKYIAGKDESLELPVRCLEDTILKLVYGVPDEVLDLVRVDNVGRARALQLYAADVRVIEDILMRSDVVLTTLGQKIGAKVIRSAREICPTPF